MTRKKTKKEVPADLADVFIVRAQDDHNYLREMARVFPDFEGTLRQMMGNDDIMDGVADLMKQASQSTSMGDFYQRVESQPHEDPSDKAEMFVRALAKSLPGKANAGARKKLRGAARVWASSPPEVLREITLRQAVEAAARTLALTVTGRHAVESVLRQVEE